MGWTNILIFLMISALFCAVGFKKYVYFLSIGYGFSVGALGITYIVFALINGWDFSIVTILQCILLVAYGIRLSGFLLVREIKNLNYQKVLKEVTKDSGKPMPFFVKFSIWICVAILYVAQTSPIYFRCLNGDGKDLILPSIGIIISVIGLVLESISDKQKGKQKEENPNMVATKQLFKLVRCPNYFGEILFWTGVFVGGVNSLQGIGQWLTATLGYICIVYVMINGAQRLDRRQEKRYGSMSEYRAYVDHTPIIIPLLPIYHIGKYK